MGTVAFTALSGAAAALIAVLAVELQPSAADDQAAVPLPTPLRTASRPAAKPGIQQQALAEILARPLFSPSRRSAATPTASAAPPAVLPRLAGTIVHGVDRSVILTLAGGGKPVVAHEGSEVGGYTVRAIQAGRVTMAGPDGEHVLRPTFGPQAGVVGLSAQPLVGTPALPPGAAGPASLNLPGLGGFAGLPAPQSGSAR